MSAAVFRDIKGAHVWRADGCHSQLIVFETFETTLSHTGARSGWPHRLVLFFFLDISVMQDEMAHIEDKT